MTDLPPLMFHFADAENTESISDSGLLSTNELLRRGRFGAEIDAVVRAHRPHGVTLPSGAYVRDQAPMPPAALAGCLDPGLTPQHWYDLVNDHVFFWLSDERVHRHRAALRRRAQLLLSIDVAALIAEHAEAVYLTPFNVGNARRAPARRGIRTLVPLERWRTDRWTSEALPGARVRSASYAPAELLVRGAVPDIARFIVRSEWIAPVADRDRGPSHF
jgi:hypothetical protein